MALTKVSTDGVKDDAITKTKIPANQIEASELADNAVDTNAIADDAVTYDKIQNVAADRILGRPNGAGTGGLNSLTPAEVRTIINVADGATNSTSTTINNNADNRVITGSGTANTLEGEANLKYDGTLKLNGLTNTAGQNSDALTVNRADGLQLFGINWNVNANEVSFSGNTKNYVFKNKSGSAESIRFPSTGGITFNGDTAAANKLDDYEEGTWTPTVSYGSGGYQSANNVVCTYTKVGNLVHVSGRFSLTQSGSGDLAVEGLPFAKGNPSGDGNSAGIQIYVEGAASNIANDIVGLVLDASTAFLIRRSGSTSSGGDMAGLVDSGTNLLIGGCYQAG